MDQIFFNANPTQRQLADHATRSSDGLHGESKKSARKDKVGAAQEVDQAAVTADPATMGEEMMGDLDPDSSRRRKPPHLESPRTEEEAAARRGQSAGGGLPSNALPPALRRQAILIPKARGAPDETPDDGDSTPDAEGRAVPSDDAGSGARDQSSDETADTQAETAMDENQDAMDDTPQAPSKETRRLSMAAVPATDHADLSRPAPVRSPTPDGPPSLMFDPWGDEFLIADPDRAASAPAPLQEAADAATEKDWPAPLAAAPPVKREAALNTLILGGAAPALEDRVRSLLTLFGDPVLALWHQACLRVVILEPDRTLPDAITLGGGLAAGPPALPSSAAAVRRGYLAQWRLVVINAEDLSQEQMSRPLRDLALGLDHALGGAAFASEQSRTIRQCFRACAAGEPAHRFLESGGAEGPSPYFAQAVEAYLTAPARLRAADPVMADLVNDLFSHPRENSL